MAKPMTSAEFKNKLAAIEKQYRIRRFDYIDPERIERLAGAPKHEDILVVLETLISVRQTALNTIPQLGEARKRLSEIPKLDTKLKMSRKKGLTARHQKHAEEVAGLVEALDQAAESCRLKHLVNGRWGFGASREIEKKAAELWLQTEGASADFFKSKVTDYMVKVAMDRAKNPT